MENNIEKRLEKIENWLQFEQGNFYYELVHTLLKYSVFFFLGYLLYSAFISTALTVLIEQLPRFCESI